MSKITFHHWSQVPSREWKWPNFTPQEIACRGTGAISIEVQAMDKLQALRNAMGVPLIVRSAYRSPQHNANVGGAKESQHMRGVAFDISMGNVDPEEFEREAKRVGFTGFGFYPASNFIHVDTGRVRSWGTRFKKRKNRFATEKRPKENLSESRTMQGGALATGATVAAAAEKIEEVNEHISSGTVIGLVLAALVAVGLAYMIYARWDDAGRPSFKEIFGRDKGA